MLALVLVACGDDGGGSGGGAATTTSTTTTSSSMSQGGSGQGGMGQGGEGGTIVIGPCVQAEGPGAAGTDTWQDDDDTTTVVVSGDDACARSYQLTTTAPLRDNQPSNPRTYSETLGQPVVRTNNDLFDALYALAIEESREGSVDAIHDGAFNGGQPLPCPTGGCFETGRLWTYVWTRDTAYSVALGLGQLDPVRAKNSLAFKTSTWRDGTRLEIVQDTGSGGSWPISTDRVVWAVGAWELLKYLGGSERTAFRDQAHEALTNTIERDRLAVFDERSGLYRGEQSFLDWREQTYPAWTATDTAQIGMSKALGTNVLHMRALEIASALSTEKGDTAAADKYAAWAGDLRDAIRSRLWIEERGLFSTYVTTELDPGPSNRFDLLGSSLAILFDAATPEQAAEVVAGYPHLPKGAPVIWPQQKDTAIYHNRAMWPFVTAYFAKAAAKADNAAAIDNAVRSLVRGAAMNLSNMENFEGVTGANWLDEGPTSGPVVNSQRQLWSIAGYLGMVNEVVFGLHATQTGIGFSPKITREMRRTFFAGADTIALSNLRYRGKRISVSVQLPEVAAGDGVLSVTSVKLNGIEVGDGVIEEINLHDDSLFEITLADGPNAAQGITLVDEAMIADYKNVFAPRSPNIINVSLSADRLQVSWDPNGEAAADVTFRVYRDGALVSGDLPGSSVSFIDQGSAAHATTSYCYTVEAVYASGNASQRAKPVCYWGPGNTRIQTFGAQGFTASGGTLVFNYGRWHHEDWGDPADTLSIGSVTASQSGRHLLQVLAGNGAGGFTTGVTCGVKSIEVWNGPTLVGSGQLAMPHLGTWNDWRDSTFVSVDLQAGTTYAIVIREDSASGNMSDLDHFSLYGGTGGTGGRFNKVNISEVKVLAMGAP
ncbi:MAG: hypothetical protein HOV80_21075 [Polyangiaceae bacterium]|nr:hypothetical protein [Polyangiaceae bacterium]